jgi:hypothetical protein
MLMTYWKCPDLDSAAAARRFATDRSTTQQLKPIKPAASFKRQKADLKEALLATLLLVQQTSLWYTG